MALQRCAAFAEMRLTLVSLQMMVVIVRVRP
jgi:hypothetical protein